MTYLTSNQYFCWYILNHLLFLFWWLLLQAMSCFIAKGQIHWSSHFISPSRGELWLELFSRHLPPLHFTKPCSKTSDWFDTHFLQKSELFKLFWQARLDPLRAENLSNIGYEVLKLTYLWNDIWQIEDVLNKSLIFILNQHGTFFSSIVKDIFQTMEHLGEKINCLKQGVRFEDIIQSFFKCA